MTDLKGFSLPLTPEGRQLARPRAALALRRRLPRDRVLGDPDAVAAVLPPGLEPYADDPGRAAALFVDWQSCVTDRNELIDPARSQYKEFFLS